jgi:ribose transport system permease protein
MTTKREAPRKPDESIYNGRTVTEDLGASTVIRPAAGAHRWIVEQISRFSGIIVWAAFVLTFALWTPSTFLSQATFKTIASGQASAVVIAIGLLFTLGAGQYDLSAAQNLGLSAVVIGALMVHSHFPPEAAVLITLVIGGAIGLVNGLLVTRVRLSSFIATLGTSSVLLAFTEFISGDNFIGPLPNSFQSIAAHSPLGVPIVTIYALILSVIVWYVLEHSPLGRRLFAAGANPDASRLAGIRVNRNVVGAFITTGFFASLAGVLSASQLGQVSSTVGPSYLLPAFAACFLGTTQVKVGRFNVWGTLLAIYLLATGIEGLQLLGGPPWVTDLFNGLALVGAVSFAATAQRRRVDRVRAADTSLTPSSGKS